MVTVGLQDLRQHAAELVRRAAAGETITVAVDGREVAELTSIHRNRWRSGAELTAIFAGPADPDWAEDRDALDGSLSAW